MFTGSGWAVTATALSAVAFLRVGTTGVRMAQANLAELLTRIPVPDALTIPGWLGNGFMGHAPQVLVASIPVTSCIRIPDLTALVVAAWIVLHGQPSR
jgi:hypothetical protein